MTTTLEDRAAGSIMGAFIGDALGLGPHWYYDLKEQHQDYGAWITDYTDPKPHRYHGGMKAGQLSQTGFVMELLLDTLVDQGGYDEESFCQLLDEKFLPFLDGTPKKGPGGYINHSFRKVWKLRVVEKKPWGEVANNVDTSEAAERIGLIAARYAGSPSQTADWANRCCLLTQDDSLVAQQSVGYALLLAALIRGEAFDANISDKLIADVQSGAVPFVASSSIIGHEGQRSTLGFPSPDALLLPSWIAEAALDPDVRIEPAWKASVVYGMSCAINFVLPSAYYLAARFSGDFESAILHALNGGGQNMSRACLTGALVGAQVGLSGIPQRFIDGLEHGASLLEKAQAVARSAAGISLEG